MRQAVALATVIKAIKCVNTRSMSKNMQSGSYQTITRKDREYHLIARNDAVGDIVSSSFFRPFSAFECCQKQWTMEEHSS